MFRSIQTRINKRVESLKTKTEAQKNLEQIIRGFLIQEFGIIGENLSFRVIQDKNKLRLRLENKVAANEIVVRSNKLSETLKKNQIRVEFISIE